MGVWGGEGGTARYLEKTDIVRAARPQSEVGTKTICLSHECFYQKKAAKVS